jgi:hypothetical protein
MICSWGRTQIYCKCTSFYLNLLNWPSPSSIILRLRNIKCSPLATVCSVNPSIIIYIPTVKHVKNVSLIPPVSVYTIEHKSLFLLLSLYVTHQSSRLAKPARNTNRWLTDVESLGAIYKREFELLELTSSDSEILALLYLYRVFFRLSLK